MTALTIELPDQLVEEARDAGLLTPEEIEAMSIGRIKGVLSRPRGAVVAL